MTTGVVVVNGRVVVALTTTSQLIDVTGLIVKTVIDGMTSVTRGVMTVETDMMISLQTQTAKKMPETKTAVRKTGSQPGLMNRRKTGVLG